MMGVKLGSTYLIRAVLTAEVVAGQHNLPCDRPSVAFAQGRGF